MTWPKIALNEVLTENNDRVLVEATSTFAMAGIYSYARGLFAKSAVNGVGTAYKVFHRIGANQLVLSTLKGWEGAIALASPSSAGRFLPPHNLLFDIDSDTADPHYVGWAVKQPQLWEALRGASRGMGARRETVSATDLLTYCVPLPPICEQRRIVARLDAAAAAVARVHALHAATSADLASLIVRANEAFGSFPVPLCDALTLDEDRVVIAADVTYPQVGIRGFGGGLFRKGGVTAAETTYRHFNRLATNQFVVSQVKGWEGAVAVCDDDHADLFVSPEDRTFRCNPGVLRPAYLAYLCRSPWFHQKLAPATRGQGARRERLRPEMLLALTIPLPPIDVQDRLLPIFVQVHAATKSSSAEHLEHLLPAMLNEAFGG